jgi:hypothetical protein
MAKNWTVLKKYEEKRERLARKHCDESDSEQRATRYVLKIQKPDKKARGSQISGTVTSKCKQQHTQLAKCHSFYFLHRSSLQTTSLTILKVAVFWDLTSCQL